MPCRQHLYAKSKRNDFSAIFWLNINDATSLQSSFQRAAGLNQRAHPSADLSGGEPKEIIAAFNAWLSLPGNNQWLLIFDNYDNPTTPGVSDPSAIDIEEYLPEAYQGHILITTRVADLQIGQPIPVRKIQKTNEVLEMLGTHSGRDGLDTSEGGMELIEQLDGLPLAIATAGAYLRHTSMTLSQYSKLYKESWAKLQRESPALRAYDDRRLYSTWQVSLDRVREENAPAAELLRLWSYLDNGDVWFELLHRGQERGDYQSLASKHSPQWFRSSIQDEISFSTAIRVLCNYGLVENKTDTDKAKSSGYRIHACVHSWATHVLNPEIDAGLVSLALFLTEAYLTDKVYIRSWAMERRLLAHALRCLDFCEACHVEGQSWAINNLARLLRSHGFLRKAETLFKRLLEYGEKTLGSSHKEVLGTSSNVAHLYNEEERHEEAQQMYEQTLRDIEHTLGPDHEDTLRVLHSLADTYRDQEKWDGAEAMYTRAIEGRNRTLVPDHQDTLQS